VSLLRHLYYELKPYLPFGARIAFRRFLARRVLSRSSHCWPILESAANPPEGWVGWPQGKKFALVLTHDVESEKGLKRSLKLAEMERALGFRSSFNFIPEGGYVTPPSLRESLIRNGFEVGVHDLRHDGKLYRSQKTFQKAAIRINHYLHEWNAVGFRSGFMHHNLEWLHHLDIEYDMSTFDTDPFEPQPDGVNTIFPFWVSPRNGNGAATTAQLEKSSPGYVELPYTLTQDSTLFLLLQERSNEIWRKKTEWLAAHGGMVLLNVHPDYVSFDQSPGEDEYPAALYSDFLQHIARTYKDAYWLALPTEVASFFRSTYIDRRVHPGALRDELSWSQKIMVAV
jgi:hypothetical protein